MSAFVESFVSKGTFSHMTTSEVEMSLSTRLNLILLELKAISELRRFPKTSMFDALKSVTSEG
jgi:hypothetical protein